MNLLLRTALALLVFASANARAEPFPEMELSMGMYRIEAEVAATAATRQRGLMFREKMPANHGMLFVFPESRQQCMWMKNTLLPLSVAFLDDKGIIVNIEEMAPQTLNNHCSAGPTRIALEMNAGWFSQRGFGPGTALRGLERAPLPQCNRFPWDVLPIARAMVRIEALINSDGVARMECQEGKHVRRTEREWRTLFDRQAGSGQSVATFCRQAGICVGSFYRWRRRCGAAAERAVREPDRERGGFLDLGALTAGATAHAKLDLKLDLGDGLILHLVRH